MLCITVITDQIVQIPKIGPQPKTTKRRSEPKRDRQSQPQTQNQETFNSKLKAQEQLDRSINCLQQTLTRLQNQQTWFEAQPTQAQTTNTEQRVSLCNIVSLSLILCLVFYSNITVRRWFVI